MLQNLKKWDYKPDQDNPPPPEEVFYLDPEDKEVEWKKLFKFASHCVTFNEEKEKECPYPISEEGWDYLKKMLYHMFYEEELIILKVRQILATWSLAVLMVWTAMSKPNKTCAFISKGEDEGKEFIRNRCAYIYDRLPDAWKEAVPIQEVKGQTHQAKQIAWQNRSRIRSFSSAGASGRSFVFSRAAIDEANYIQHCKDLRASLRPALNKRPLTILSTPYAVESDFEEIVMDAEAGNGGTYLTFPVACRPGRDEKWQSEMKRRLKDKYDTEFGLKFAIREENALFPTFNQKIHVVTDKFIKEMISGTGYSLHKTDNGGGTDSVCPAYAGLDPHITKPSAVAWMVVLPNNSWYFIDELWLRGDIKKLAHIIKSREMYMRVVDRALDPFGNMRDILKGADSTRQMLRDEGVLFRTAKRERFGFSMIQGRLQPGPDGLPRVFFNERCEMLIRQMRTAGMEQEGQANKGGKYHHVDCAKYIANMQPMFDQIKYQHENKDLNTEVNGIIRDMRDNLNLLQSSGRYSTWRSQSTL